MSVLMLRRQLPPRDSTLALAISFVSSIICSMIEGTWSVWPRNLTTLMTWTSTIPRYFLIFIPGATDMGSNLILVFSSNLLSTSWLTSSFWPHLNRVLKKPPRFLGALFVTFWNPMPRDRSMVILASSPGLFPYSSMASLILSGRFMSVCTFN